MSKRNEFIDIMRIVCCIMVICIHTSPLIKISPILNYGLCHIISRIAVPFFFITSGYFFAIKLYSRDEKRTLNIKRYIGNQIKIYLITSLIYSFFNIFIFETVHFDSVKNILDFLRTYIFTGYYHLWYLNASIISLILINIIYSRFKEKSIVIFSLVLYLIGTLLNTYSFVLQQTRFELISYIYYLVFVTSRNGLFFGFPMMIMGIMVYKYKLYGNLKSSVLGLIISFFIYIMETIFLKLIGDPVFRDMYIFLIPVTYFLFLTLINLKDTFPNKLYIFKNFISYFSNLTLVIYCVHILVINFTRSIFNTSGGLIELLIVFIFSTIIAIFVTEFKSKFVVLKNRIDIRIGS